MNLIKKCREQSGLSQFHVATVLRKTVQEISNWERSAAIVPPKHYKKLGRIFKIDPEEFVKENLKRHEMIIRKKSGVK